MRMTSMRVRAAIVVALLVANLIALNLIVSGPTGGPFGGAVRALRARIDLTEGGEYTISEATKKILAELPDVVTIHGFFSKETHPKLQPLVPRIRDLLEEYRVASNGKIELSFADPRGDDELEKEVYQQYGVRPTPFRIRTMYESGVKSAYFHLVVTYGDQHETLGFDDMVRVDPDPSGTDVIVRLSNLEYEITRAIQKVVRGFGSLESRLAELEKPVKLEIFLTDPERVPEDAERVRTFLSERKKVLETVVNGLEERFKAGFEATIADPTQDAQALARARQRYRLRPLQGARGEVPALWCAAVVIHGQRGEQIAVQGGLGGGDDSFEIRNAIEAAIRRLLPGAMRRIGIVSSGPDISPEQRLRMQMMGQQPPSDGFDTLRRILRERFQVQNVSLKEGKPPLDVDVLLVLAPDELSEIERFALDQYLMLGGKVIVALEAAKLDLEARMGLQLKESGKGMAEWLAAYGVKPSGALVLDDRNFPYPLPIEVAPGLRVVQDVRYPWFVDVRADGIDRESPITSRLDRVVLLWTTSLGLDDDKISAFTERGGKVTKLLYSSERAWTSKDFHNVEPGRPRPDGRTYTVPEKTERVLLALALAGRFESAFKGKPVPNKPAREEKGGAPGGGNPFGARLPGGSGADGGEGGASTAPSADQTDKSEAGADAPDAGAESGAAGSKGSEAKGESGEAEDEQALVEPIPESVETARLAVIGDADWLSDIGARVLGQDYVRNVALLDNLIDWSLLDETLLEIRARGSRDRPLEELTKAQKQRIELVNYALPSALVVLLGIGRWLRRRRAERRRGGEPID